MAETLMLVFEPLDIVCGSAIDAEPISGKANPTIACNAMGTAINATINAARIYSGFLYPNPSNVFE